MKFIKENSIGKAWLMALEYLTNYGNEVNDRDNELLIEKIPMIIEMHNPLPMDKILKDYGSHEYIDFMSQNFQQLRPILNWGYSYAQRLYNFNGINQIEEIINLFKGNRYCKSATISLLDRIGDIIHKPCLVSIDFKVREDNLLIIAFFRSQDIGKKMYADAIELLKIGQYVADKLEIKGITVIHFISSAHIYKKDLKFVLNLLDKEGIEYPDNIEK